MQAGLQAAVPFLSFATFTFRWTDLEPYMYTHHPVVTPWYSQLMYENYENNAFPLGYYLSPNSNEFLVRFESPLIADLTCSLQYQLVIHGAENGPGEVDGSSYLDSDDYEHDSDQIRHKYFLHDGAYQWQNILQLGASYDFSGLKVPLKLGLGAGFVITSWSRTAVADGTKQNYTFSMGDWAQYYTNSIRPIITLGLTVFQ
jgi:hypothetical protein